MAVEPSVSQVSSTFPQIVTSLMETMKYNLSISVRQTSIGEISHAYVGSVVVLGLVGNILCIIMFLASSLRDRSPAQYLIALAAVDAGFLVTVLLTWIRGIGIAVYSNRFVCKATNFFAYCCSFLSGWIIIAFTMERFIIVFYPLYRSRICTVRRARIIVSLLTVFAVLVNSWVLVLTDFNGSFCGITGNRTEYSQTFLSFSIFDMILTFGIPSIVIVALNTAIAFQISKSFRLRQALTVDMYHVGFEHTLVGVAALTELESCLNRPGNRRKSAMAEYETRYVTRASQDPFVMNATLKQISQHGTASRRKMSLVRRYNERRITILLVTVSMCYILLNSPAYSLRLFNSIMKASGMMFRTHGLSICTHIFQMLFYTQYSVNFFLYSWQGRLYRNVSCVRATIKRGRDFSTSIRWRLRDGSFNQVRVSAHSQNSRSKLQMRRCSTVNIPPFNDSKSSGAERTRKVSFNPVLLKTDIAETPNQRSPEELHYSTPLHQDMDNLLTPGKSIIVKDIPV